MRLLVRSVGTCSCNCNDIGSIMIVVSMDSVGVSSDIEINEFVNVVVNCSVAIGDVFRVCVVMGLFLSVVGLSSSTSKRIGRWLELSLLPIIKGLLAPADLSIMRPTIWSRLEATYLSKLRYSSNSRECGNMFSKFCLA